MRMMMTAVGAAVLAFAVTAPVKEAGARFYDPALNLPSLAETVACRTVRQRVVRPGGRVVYTTRRVCTPGWRAGWRGGCRMVRERVVRPNGTVVYRSVRRC